jgi:N-ethylmaleimide reductase
MVAGGFDAISAEAALARGDADLIGFGRPFIANPDLPARLRRGATLAPADRRTFYSEGPSGYIDYLTLEVSGLAS